MLDTLFRSLRAFVRDFAVASPGGSTYESDGITAGIVPRMRDRSFVNSVVYDDAAELETRLPEIAAAYDQAGILAWTVWVRPGDDSTARGLEAAGHVLDGEPMAMGMTIAGIDPPAPGELELYPPDAATLSGVLAESYGFESFRQAVVRWKGNYHPYLAEFEGEPSATLAVLDHEGDAHVTLVGTIEDARGSGLATLLMRRALHDAQRRGRATTTLVATEMGHPLYSRLGYEDLGRVQMWERRKPG